MEGDRRGMSPARPEPMVYVPFTSGRRVAVDVIRNELTYLPVEVLADLSDLSIEDFLEQLDTWATDTGLPYGITVDREAQRIAVAGRGVVAERLGA